MFFNGDRTSLAASKDGHCQAPREDINRSQRRMSWPASFLAVWA